MATTEHIKHAENGSIGYFSKDHSNQKNYRDSEALWFTVSAMAKIQEVLKVTDISVSPLKATIEAFKAIGVILEPVDFNRNKDALESKAEPVLKANADNAKFMELFKLGYTEAQIKALMAVPVAKVEPVVEKPKVDVSNTETLAQILKLLSGK